MCVINMADFYLHTYILISKLIGNNKSLNIFCSASFAAEETNSTTAIIPYIYKTPKLVCIAHKTCVYHRGQKGRACNKSGSEENINHTDFML